MEEENKKKTLLVKSVPSEEKPAAAPVTVRKKVVKIKIALKKDTAATGESSGETAVPVSAGETAAVRVEPKATAAPSENSSAPKIQAAGSSQEEKSGETASFSARTATVTRKPAEPAAQASFSRPKTNPDYFGFGPSRNGNRDRNSDGRSGFGNRGPGRYDGGSRFGNGQERSGSFRTGENGGRFGGQNGFPRSGSPSGGNRFSDRNGGRSGGFASGTPGRTGGGNRPFGGNSFGSRPSGGGPAALPQKKVKKFYTKGKNKEEERREQEEILFSLKAKKESVKTNSVPKEINILDAITVSELAKKMNLKASDLIAKLMSMGMMCTINDQLDADTASILADEFGCKVNVVSLYDETVIESQVIDESKMVKRPPIVTVMGHVDHGKTRLLDVIRESNKIDTESGGITQHIGAYKVTLPGDQEIVFLDTPGHEAFTLMRARGAQITDIVVLVVAANDGVMPQTVEAINHAKAAGVPIIVAVNKMDLADANPDRVKQQLSEHGLVPEDWGGDTIFCEISALKKTGIDNLLENIILLSEVLELKAGLECRAEGTVLETRVDNGRGIISTVIIQQGVLRTGDPFVAGVYSGKVRAMFSDSGKKIKEATPATPVEIIGFDGIPDAGVPFTVTESEKEAKNIAQKRQELEKAIESKNLKKITLDNLYSTYKEGNLPELKVIIKGDVQGSVEAIQAALEKLSNDEIRLHVIHTGVGAIVENDVNLAMASNAIIIGFHVRPIPKAAAIAEEKKVEIRKYSIIYDVVEDIELALEGMLSPEYEEKLLGSLEVRDTFRVPKVGIIAGCHVTSGVVKRNGRVRLFRDNVEIYSGKIASLKHFKDDVKEMKEGFDCGLGIENCQDIQVGDVIEAYEMVEIKRHLKSADEKGKKA